MNRRTLFGIGIAGLILLIGLIWMFKAPKKVDFNTEIRPILNNNCVSCHGGVKRKAGFSLVFRDEAILPAESGKIPIVPGDPGASELLNRVKHHDEDERMPLDKPALSQQEIQLLQTWIKEGAEYETHWAYIAPVKPKVPRNPSWGQNEIDAFAWKKMKSLGLEPNEEADRATLMRRLALDITGLPPSPEEVETFVKDADPNAYEKVVDGLLENPHFGEKWAAMWLDLARYADSKGYEKDPERSIWQFRDWVIKAFNQDMPFDQFTKEQLAGDLLPEPNRDQIIATAFHRNSQNNTEGGTEDEEFRIATVMDRINTTYTVWQSTTMECVQCHGHPYDPFTHEDYYTSFDFFNQDQDADLDSEWPVIESYEEKDKNKLASFLQEIEKHGGEKVVDLEIDDAEKIKRAFYPRIMVGDADDWQDVEIYGYTHAVNWARNPNNIPEKRFLLRFDNIDLSKVTDIAYEVNTVGTYSSVRVRIDDKDGKLIQDLPLPKTKGRETLKGSIEPTQGVHTLWIEFINSEVNHPDGRFTIHSFELVQNGEEVAGELRAYQDSLIKFRSNSILTPVMKRKTQALRRETYRLHRGVWNSPTDSVLKASSPATLPQAQGTDRLALAEWLMGPENPLTARVIVNRVWEQIFGLGIIETTEDFGSQGMKPTHPELLDWLALHMRDDCQWSVKALIKTIVMSAIYRQNSLVSPEKLEKDARNLYFARGPRIRLSAEQVRDQALAVSGLLSKKMFGPSVYPHQPKGVWNIPYSAKKWIDSEGEDKYRRGIYTYWRRTSPYPSMATFDSPSRELCASRRISTNTPLQALVILNDPVYVEAAAALGKRMMEESGETTEDKLARGFELVLLKKPDESQKQILQELYNDALAELQTSKGLIQTVANIEEENKVEQQALAVVASALMNLDAFIMKE